MWKKIGPVVERRKSVPYRRCVCACGEVRVVSDDKLKRGLSKSCGCLRVKLLVTRQLKHGLSKTPEYHAWVQAKNRCTNKKDPSWPRYGGRGIKMCVRWLDATTGFENFLSDMGARPTVDSTLERENNDKGYHPLNCVWANQVTQANNRGSNRKITHDGRTMTLTEWSRETGVPVPTLWHRINRGWLMAEAIKPAKRNK